MKLTIASYKPRGFKIVEEFDKDRFCLIGKVPTAYLQMCESLMTITKNIAEEYVNFYFK